MLPQTVFDRWQEQRRDLDLPVFDPALTFHGRGVPDDEIGLVGDCSEVAPRVVAGILEHRSQLDVMADDPIDRHRLERIVRREWASVIWPARTASDLVLTDIFDGI